MINFCPKCGSKTDPATGLCPNGCLGALPAIPKASPKAEQKKHIGLKITALVLAVLIVFSAVAFALAYFDIAKIPPFSSIADSFKKGGDSDGTLFDLKAEVCDILVGDDRDVLFTVEYLTDGKKAPDDEIELFDAEDKFIALMKDDGKNGDKDANDGIYSAKVEMSSDERSLASFYAKVGSLASNSFDVCYYEELTEEDHEAFEELVREVFSESDVKDALRIVKRSPLVEKYKEIGNRISFTTVSGMTAIYDASYGEGFKASGSNSVPTSMGVDYTAAGSSLRYSDLKVLPEYENGNVAVLRPFRNNGFNYDDFRDAGNLLATFTGGTSTVYDDSSADLECWKSLDGNKFVLVDSHGTLSDVTNSAWDIFPTDPYLLTGEVYSAGKMWTSADWQASRIVVCGTAMFSGEGIVAVGAGFFDKYYDVGDFDDTLFFLGTCYSAHNSQLADVLIKKGASVVYGYTEPVSVTYCNQTLFETVVNSLLLSGSTASESFKSATDTYGEYDPSSDPRCYYKRYGKADYKIAEPCDRVVCLVLDTSGSMGGTPIAETRSAAVNFVSSVFSGDEGDNTVISLITYSSSAIINQHASSNEDQLIRSINSIGASGNTNIESGLSLAESILSKSKASKKIIVLMSDGLPNRGKEGDSLVSYADSIKAQDIYIYTLGFFQALNSSEMSSAQQLMNRIAGHGCHYEVNDAESLNFFFGDIADQIDGQRYIYVRIACPVDVSVAYEGEKLNSKESDLNTRTSFGSLSFEESDSDKEYDEGVDDRIKILRLKAGAEYEIKIKGTARGTMDYTIGFMDENGDYSDMRTFENIKITKKTEITTVAGESDSTVLKVDEDGDGKNELTYEAEEGGTGELVKESYTALILAIVLSILAVAIIAVVIIFVASNKKKQG